LHLAEHLTSRNPAAQALLSEMASADAAHWDDQLQGLAGALRQLWSLTFREAQTPGVRRHLLGDHDLPARSYDPHSLHEEGLAAKRSPAGCTLT